MATHEPRPGPSAFPPTRRTLIEALREADPEQRRIAQASLIAAYWRPAYVYLRLRRGHSAADAEDLVQGFFAGELEREFLQTFDPAKARFRTFLRVCLDRHAAHAAAARSASKRGGGQRIVALDFDGAERTLGSRRSDASEPVGEDDVDEFFTREWRRALFSAAIDQLAKDCERAGHASRYAAFAAIDLAEPHSRPSYADVAARLGRPVTTINNDLAAARRDLRAIVIDLLRAQCIDENDFQEQLAALFRGAS